MVAPGTLPRAPGRPDADDAAAPLHPALFALVALAGGLVVGAAANLGPMPALGALGAAMAGYWLLRHPAIAAVVLVALVPAASGLKRGVPVPGLRLSEVLIGALAVAILLTVRRGRAARWGAFDWLALAYAVTVAVLGAAALLSRGEALGGDVLGDLLGPLQFVLLYRAVRTAVTSDAHRAAALRWALLAAVPVCLLTFAQVADVGGVRTLLFSITADPDAADLFADAQEEGVGRATGPFVIWHTLSAYLWLVALLAAGLALGRDRTVLPGWALLAVLSLCSTAILLTISATPAIALVAGLLWLAGRHGRLTQATLALALAGLAAALALAPSISARSEQQQLPASTGASPLVPQTIAFRWDVWTEQYLPVIEANLLTGYGPGVPASVTWESTESIYITMLMRGGLGLLVIYIALMLSLYGWARWARRRAESPLGRTVGEVLAVAVLILFAYQALIPLFMITGMPHLLWALAGLLPARGEPGAQPVSAVSARAPASVV